jgi:hypothetical protein
MENEATECYFHMLRGAQIHKDNASDISLRVPPILQAPIHILPKEQSPCVAM